MPPDWPTHSLPSSGNASGISESPSPSPAPAAQESLLKRPQGWLLCLFLYVLALPIFLRPASMTWHDWQRIIQVTLSVCAASYLLLTRAKQPLDARSRALLTLIAIGGVLSSLIAPHPLWALTEVALMLSCISLVWATADVRQRLGPTVDRWLLVAVLVICSLKALQFSVSYILALANAVKLDPWRLMEGFSNIRFYGQFITISLPLLALPLLAGQRPTWQRIFGIVLLSAWWMLAITSGTRGTWLAIIVAMVIMSATGKPGRRWATWQLCGALGGGLLFWCLFTAVPALQGLDVGNHPAARLNTNLSLRDSLWRQALQMTMESPWLGAAPMHFAAIFNGNAVHPHNSLLQWLAEWGVASTLMVVVLLWQAALAIGKRLASPDVSPLYCCLSASLIAALSQSMVDGVIVMPYMQLWLSLIAGLLLATHQGAAEAPRSTSTWAITAMAAAVLLAGVVARDVLTLEERKQQFLRTHDARLMPRFWNQGLIGSEKSESDTTEGMVPQRGIEPPTY